MKNEEIKGKIFVLTGFDSRTKKEFTDRVTRYGGTVKKTVDRETDVLVYSTRFFAELKEYSRAEELYAEGVSIALMSDDDFLGPIPLAAFLMKEPQYSEDGKTLLRYPYYGAGTASVRPGTERIANEAFYGCRELTEVILPDGVEKIGDYAFALCDTLQSITIPNTVRTVGAFAFFYCKRLNGITLPDGLTVIGKEAFMGCRGLTEIAIPDSVVSMGVRAFSYCNRLKTLRLPSGITELALENFSSCSSLTEVVLPDGVSSVGNYAFCKCEALKTVVLPDSVRRIGHGAFNGCKSLTEFTIPDGVTELGFDAFRWCNHLESVTIPDSVTQIGDNVFDECPLVQINASEAVCRLLWEKTVKRTVAFALGMTRDILSGFDFIRRYLKSHSDEFFEVLKNNVTAAGIKNFLAVKKHTLDKLDQYIDATENTELKAALLAYKQSRFTAEAQERAENRRIERELGL